MDEQWYDEAFSADGLLRPPYAAMRERTGWDPMRPTSRAASRLRDRPLDDDARILPLPLVLDEEEYRSVLQAGVSQRARVLQQLFADVVLGAQQALRAGIGLTADIIDDVLAADGTTRDRLRRLWGGRDRQAIRFVYGPDLVRDHTGRWLVLEDNVGCVGGSVDAIEVAARYRKATRLTDCPTCDRQPDLAVATRQLRDLSGHDRGGEVLAVLGCEAGGEDPWAFLLRENARRRHLFDRLGIAVVDSHEFDRRWAAGQVPRPSTLINFDVGSCERSSLGQAFADPGIVMLNAPGTGALGSKALLPYVDDLTRFYIGEEPILAVPPTRLLSDGGLPADGDGWVVKASAGRQGTEVFVLTGQPRHRREHIELLLQNEWSAAGAVAQRYVEPSRLSPGPGGWDGYQVEIRPVSYVLGWQDVCVGRQPVGKFVSVFDARRLNNISQGACYGPVLREPCCPGADRGTRDAPPGG